MIGKLFLLGVAVVVLYVLITAYAAEVQYRLW